MQTGNNSVGIRALWVPLVAVARCQRIAQAGKDFQLLLKVGSAMRSNQVPQSFPQSGPGNFLQQLQFPEQTLLLLNNSHSKKSISVSISLVSNEACYLFHQRSHVQSSSIFLLTSLQGVPVMRSLLFSRIFQVHLPQLLFKGWLMRA